MESDLDKGRLGHVALREVPHEREQLATQARKATREVRVLLEHPRTRAVPATQVLREKRDRRAIRDLLDRKAT